MENTILNRLCIVPRWGGTSKSEWYPWLCEHEQITKRFHEFARPDIDVPATPTIAAWTASLTAALGPGGPDRAGQAEKLARTFLLGHSVGCQAVLRYLESLPEGAHVAGCLLVAGWWTVDEPWDTIRPWLHPPESDDVQPLDMDRVRAAGTRFVVLISDNDPFTADWQTTKAAWQDRLGATVRVVAGAKHFNSDRAPEVVDALLELTE